MTSITIKQLLDIDAPDTDAGQGLPGAWGLVDLELPEGVRLDLSAYVASHGAPADQFGRWGFGPGTARNPVRFTGDPGTAAVWITAGLSDAVAQLAEIPWQHSWHLLP
jgi:hypothetical protein